MITVSSFKLFKTKTAKFVALTSTVVLSTAPDAPSGLAILLPPFSGDDSVRGHLSLVFFRVLLLNLPHVIPVGPRATTWVATVFPPAGTQELGAPNTSQLRSEFGVN